MKQVFIWGGILVPSFLILIGGEALAQERAPEFWVTWRAQSYSPADFQGKTLPTTGSEITVSFDLIDRGQVADLSKQIVYWYLNDEPIKGSEGAQSATFRIMETGFHDLLIKVPGYGDRVLTKKITLPVVDPEVIVETPFPGTRFSSLNFQLAAKPYFFNVLKASDLSFAWRVNGRAPSKNESPEVLNVNLKSGIETGSDLRVELRVLNPNRALEEVERFLNLTFTK